jgi:hypothetical protein
LIDGILPQGNGLHAAGGTTAIDATVGALAFVTPLIKHPGFQEEQEWRLLYAPLEDALPQVRFHSQRDFLAPFVTLRHLWYHVRPQLLKVPGLPIDPPPLNVPMPTGDPLVPIQSIMIGPSGHQFLNERAMQKVIAQWRAGLGLQVSNTPYRSLS